MTHRVEIDFALNRPQRARRKQMVWAVVGLIFGLQIGLAAWRAQSLEANRSALQKKQLQIANRNARSDKSALTAEQSAQAGSAQAMLDSLAVPWDSVLQAIEAARPSRLVVESIQPQQADGVINLSVNSPDYATLAEFVQQLAHAPSLQQVMLVSETLVDTGGGTLQATLSAHWKQSP